MSNFKRVEIADGIYFNSIKDEKFKSNRISINLFMPLDEKNAAANSVLSCILPKANSKISSMEEMNLVTAGMYGAVLDCDISSTGDNQYITLYVQTIDNKYALEKENLIMDIATLICDCLLKPKLIDGNFDENIFSTEKQFIIDTIESEINDKRIFAIKKLKENMFAGEPHGINKFGSLKHAKNLTLADIKQAYNNLLKSAKIEIMFTGCADSKNLCDFFKDQFTVIKRENIHQNSSIISPVKKGVKNVEETIDVNQSKLAMGFKTAPVDSYDDSLNYNVLTLLFGGTPNSRLFIYVREKLSLCYYCAANYGKQKNYILVDSGIEKDKKETVINEVLNQLSIIQNGDFAEEDLEKTKLYLENRLKSVKDSLISIEQWYLSQIINNSNLSPEEENEKINKITKQMIINAAKTLKLDTVYFLTSK